MLFRSTLVASSTGVYAPTVGAFAGSSWVISTADISGTTDPLGEPSAVAFYGFVFPAPATIGAQLINDGTFVGSAIPYGTYYWTPVVFGNAVAATNPPQFLNDLLLDPACTFTGTSVTADVLDGTSPLCGAGIHENNASNLAAFASMKDANNITLMINASAYAQANVTITDVTGRVVYTNKFYVTKGGNTEVIPAATFATGAYIINVETGYGKANTKFVKL